MKLSHEEVEQLKTAGFDQAHIEEIQSAKLGSGQGWQGLFQKLIDNGPQILTFLKLFGGLFSTPPVPPK